MTEDPNRKTLRQFQCRDYLWEAFEQMSQELECSVDYLINEAMRHYARGQGKIRQTVPPGTRVPAPNMIAPAAPNQGGPRPTLNNPGGAPVMQPVRPPMQAPAPMQVPQRATAAGGMMAPNAYGAPARPPAGGQPMGAPPGYPRMPTSGPNYAPPPMVGAGGGVLYAVYDGQKFPVNKDEFFIGRSNKNCDLIVKDPNVSRRHARVVRHQGQFWMLDMGSTNGIEFQGGRIERRQINEGDVFKICDHEIAFTYR